MKHREERNGNFTTISNSILRDKTVSLRAKGLHTLMMSLPDDWEYSVRGLAAICGESMYSVRALLNELKRAGYLKISRKAPDIKDRGRIRYIYDIYEKPCNDPDEPLSDKPNMQNEYEPCTPCESPCTESPYTESPYIESPYTESPYIESPYTESPYTVY